MKLRAVTISAVTASVLTITPFASAHVTQSTGAPAFAAGAVHPLSGIDHFLAMLAVGLWAAQLGGRAVWLLPASFVALMLGGGLLAGAGVAAPAAEQGIVASVFVLGLLVMSAARMPAWGGAMLAGAFALFHGHAHVAEMPAGQSVGAYMVGFASTTAALLAAAVLGGRYANAPARLIRFAGAAVAACGVLLFLHVL